MTISRGGDYRYDKPSSVGDPALVQSWPFPEPKKTSAWDNAQLQAGPSTLKDVPIQMRDSEKDKAAARTALMKKRMSPPGALRLPELLEANRLKYGITDAFFNSQAAFDRIFVFPIDQFDDVDTFATGGTILRPNLTKLKDLQEGHRGVLISAGLTAADRLMSHGIELGHIVTTNKNVPFARRCDRLEDGTEMFYLVMRDADLAGSETLAYQLKNDARRIIDIGGDGQYEHQVARCEDGNWTVDKKQSVYIQDAW